MRDKRKLLPNATYHTTSRCFQWRSLMAEDPFKDLFVSILRKTLEKYKFNLIFYGIMDNHIHVTIKTCPDGATISRIMQYLKSRFAESFNRMTGRIGAFWHDRFKDSIIEISNDPVFYLLWLLWYIAYNPVRKKYVNNPREYRYTSIRCYLDEDYRSPVKITLHEYFLALGSCFQERVEKFLKFEELYRKRSPDIINAI